MKFNSFAVAALACAAICFDLVAAEEPTTLQISAGQSHGLALRSDGTVWSWGTNRVGELGLGSVGLTNSPKRITSLTNMAGISAGALHSLAVGNNGIVWAWGTNSSGQLGDGTTTTVSAPVQTTRITNGVSVSAGATHSLAVLQSGSLMAWGGNTGGQLGLGTISSTNQPISVGSFTNVIMAAAGSNFSLALTAAGEVWSWGTNAQGQLGLGHTTSLTTPTKITALTGIVQIAAGGAHAMARDANGTIFAWGRNSEGQLGIGNTTSTNAPAVIASLGATKAIAAGFNSSAAISGAGRLCFWGSYTNTTNFFGNATAPVEIGAAVDERFTSVVQGEDFILATEESGNVWAWGRNHYSQWGNGSQHVDYWRYEAMNPVFSFGARPRPSMVRFHRGDREILPWNSFVLPLDLEKGVRLDATGDEQYCFSGTSPWFLRVQKEVRQHGYQRIVSTTNMTRFPVENPLAAFGSEAGGSPLYVGQPYTFGVYAGVFNENLGQSNAIRVLVYDRAALAGGTNSVAPVNTFNIGLPRRSVDATAWSNYVTNGNRLLIETNGLRTAVEFADALGGLSAYQNWGVGWRYQIVANVVVGGYRVTHQATSTNYAYIVEVQGQAEVGANMFSALSTNSTGWAYTPMYALGFDEFPQWRSRFVDNPHYEGIPLPPAYAGRRTSELNGLLASVTNSFWLTNNAAYTNLDTSPELRRHPVLDRFVEDMGRNPLALTSYVVNEIGFTDPIAIVPAGSLVADSIDLGGVSRSALGTFLEKQGSPAEQCALLVYLLRQAGYPAAYVFPTNSNLRLLDTTVSRLWQINVKGVVFHTGVPVITNSLIVANYPWVVANIGTNCVHIFPWLKNTSVTEGPDIYDFMPTNYPSAYQWVKDYLLGKPEVMGSFSVHDPLAKTWKGFLTQLLNTNQVTRNLSLDKFGSVAINQRVSYSAWNQLPVPNFLTNQTQLAVVPTFSENTNSYPFLSEIFDRVRLEVFKTDTNLVNRIVDTGLWRTCDLHNRKLLLYTNTTDNVSLWLAPYRLDTTNTVGDFTSFETGTNSLNKQVTTVSVAAGVSVLPVRVTLQRRSATYPSTAAWYPMQEAPSSVFNLSAKKRSVTAVCASFGRVTPEMLRLHAEDYWRQQQLRAADPDFEPALTDVAGTTAALLGMGFFERLWTDDQLNQRLHQVKGLNVVSWGTAALTQIEEGGALVDMDMHWLNVLTLGNAKSQQDSGDRSSFALNNYLTMLQANGSSTEHSILSSSLNTTNALSTVRLLQMAYAKHLSEGATAPLELNVKNYVALGNSTHAGYGGTLLKNQRPDLWSKVTDAFTGRWDADYLRILITPGMLTNPADDLSGMGAMSFGKWENGSILSTDDLTQNAGWSYSVGWFGAPNYSSYNLNYNLHYSVGIGYTYFPNSFSTPIPRTDFSQQDMVTITTTSGANQVAFSPQQTNLALLVTSTLNLPGGTTTAEGVKTAKDVGFLGRSWAAIKQAGALMADPVHVVSGDFYANTVDLALAGPLPLELRRNYLSRSLVDNQFGHGWKLGFTPWLVESTTALDEDIMQAAEPDGTVLSYVYQSNDVWTVTAEHNPTLVNFTGRGVGSTANLFNNRLEMFTTNGTQYVLFGADGSKRTYEVMSGFGLSSGTNSLSRVRPYLTRWEDHAGNYHLFYYGTNAADTDFGQLYRVESANGTTLTFKYDVNGRILEAMTDDDRHVHYQYDSYGDLVRVTLPDSSQWEYAYQHYTFTNDTNSYTDSTHLLVRETKPDGRVLANTYDSLRRVTVQAATVGTNRELVTNAWFFYTNNASGLEDDYLTGTTRVEDVFHNVYLYQYTDNLITQIDEPEDRTIIQDWFETGETNKTGYYQRSLEASADPRGRTSEFKYSSTGNITNLVVGGDLTGEGNASQSATNTYTFDANNLLLTMTDPVGNRRTLYYEDGTDAYRVTRLELSNGGTGIATNRYSYTNVTSTLTIGTVSKDVHAYGLLARVVQADVATNEWVHDGRGFVTQSTRYARTAEDSGNNDPAVVHSYSYTSRGDLSVCIDSAGRMIRFGHDAMGRMLWRDVLDETGVALLRENFHFNRNGDLEWYDGPRSGPEDYVWFDYDGAGRKVQQIDWRSRAKLDGSGVEAETVDSLYATTHFAYDGFGNLTRMVDPRGAITTNIWDALGRLKQQTSYDLDGTTPLATIGLGYEPGGLVSQHTNALSGVSQMLYTTLGRPYYAAYPDGSTNGWTYYLDGRLKRAYQSNGAYSENSYNDASRAVTRIFYSAAGTPLGTNYTLFDRRGFAVIQIDEAGFGSTNRFDGLGRLKSWVGPKLAYEAPEGAPPAPGTNPSAVQQAFTNYFDAVGIATTNVNALGEKAIVITDALGRVTRQEIRTSTNTLVRETSVSYSADHHSVTVTRGSGDQAIVTTSYTDNDGQNVLALAFPAAGVKQFTRNAYDVAGNLVETAQYARTNSQQTLFASAAFWYDGLGRLTQKLDRDGAVTSYGYDDAGNLIEQSLPGGLEWHAAYNTAGLMSTNWNASSGGVVRANGYTYHGFGHVWAGLPATYTDARGVVCTYSYDDYLRTTTNSYSGTLAEHSVTASWKFDVRGYLTNATHKFASTATGPNVTVQRIHNAYGQILSEYTTLGTNSFGSTHSYDAAGRRLSIGTGPYGQNFSWRADGKLTGIDTLYGDTMYGYDTAGLLTNRMAEARNTKILSRDGMGRPLTLETKANSTTRLTETLSYTGDGLIASHTSDRTADFLDQRAYTYASESRRLASERLNIDDSTTWTNVFTFDAGASQGAGVLTRILQPGGADWNAHMDSHLRVDRETNNVVRRLAYGRVNMQPNFGFATIGVKLDDRPVPFLTLGNSDTNWPTRWQAQVELLPGEHTLTATVIHPSGLYTNSSSVIFTNAAVDQTTLSYYSEGQLTSRVWKNSSGQTNRVQTFKWDAQSRLHAFTERDANGDGHDWSAVYDAFGRRWQTLTVPTTNNVALTAQTKTFIQAYDPLAEFLEMGVYADGRWSWKVHGPDLNGVYGGLNGLGGWDAVVSGPDTFYSLIQDAGGNILGGFDPEAGDVRWNEARVTGYGSIAGHRPLSLGEGAPLWEAASWRGRYPELSGLYNLGARYYDPVAGRFLSPDPLGHDSDPSLYSFANGDPVNFFDADGRIAKQYREFNYNGGVSGHTLRAAANGFRSLANTEITYLNWGALNNASLFDTAAGMVTPRSYVDGVNNTIDRSATVMAHEMANGSGTAWVILQGTSSIVGDNVGYNGVMEGGFGVDRHNGELLETSDRASRFLQGSSQIILTGTGVKSGYQPKPTGVKPPLLPKVEPPPLPASITSESSSVFSKQPSQWTGTRPKGTRQTYNVFQRNDINWQQVRTAGDARAIGLTNEEAARRFGLSPQLADGNFATLHHLGQDARGGLAEASTRYHGVGKPGQDALHSQYGRNQPHPSHPVDRAKFDVDTREYWKWRVDNQ